jgi:hypothetical protein
MSSQARARLTAQRSTIRAVVIVTTAPGGLRSAATAYRTAVENLTTAA